MKLDPMEGQEIEPEEEPRPTLGDAFFRLIEYLESDKGHTVFSELANGYKEQKSQALDLQKQLASENLRVRSYNYRFTLITNSTVLMLALILAGGLTWIDKFNTPIAGFLGTILGYLFGRQQSAK